MSNDFYVQIQAVTQTEILTDRRADKQIDGIVNVLTDLHN